MLIFDLTNDLFDQVLNGHKPIDPAIFVNDERHVHAIRLHLLQQDTNRHRRRREQELSQHLGQIEVLTRPVEPVAERKILEVHHAHRRIERALVDRQTGQTRLSKHFHEIVFLYVNGNGRDLDLGEHHILNPHSGQV